MSITKSEINYSPSVNILRDADREQVYIPTPNAQVIFEQIVNNYGTGVHAYSIIGAYGTGKSAFLLALEKELNGKAQYFKADKAPLEGLDGFEVIRLVGEYGSFFQYCAEELGLVSGANLAIGEVFSALEKRYEQIALENKGLLILVDEFGKFLEWAAKEAPDFEMYFVQRLAEFVNDPSKDAILVTTLHQDFTGYSLELSRSQREEWSKVKGRLKDLSFNEPVEQLLFLAANRLSHQELKIGGERDQNVLLSLIEEAGVFPLRDYLNLSFADKLLPFDILSAGVLTRALQDLGQNQRSLFSFIDSKDYLGIQEFSYENGEYYDLGKVYDYLAYHYYGPLHSPFIPNRDKWMAIRNGLEKVEGTLEKDRVAASKLVKAIGLLDIFGGAGKKVDYDFLCELSRLTLEIENAAPIIEDLSQRKIIRFVGHAQSYKVFQGTDLNIEKAIIEAGKEIGNLGDIGGRLIRYFDFPYLPAQKEYYVKGSPRFFSFVITEEPQKEKLEDAVDGNINLILNESLDQSDVQEFSGLNPGAVLYGVYSNTAEIRKNLREIAKVEKVKSENAGDPVAIAELNDILSHLKRELNFLVMEGLYNGQVRWFFKGKQIEISTRRGFNRQLSQICAEVYADCPIFKSELVNRTKLPTAINTARKALVAAMVANHHREMFDLPDDKYPPEKSIYLSLFHKTGIHREEDGHWGLGKPSDPSFDALWEAGEKFLASAKYSRRNLRDLKEIFEKPPLKLKQGFIDFWLPIYLFIKREEFALFSDGVYIPYLTADTLDLIAKRPKKYEIKAFDISGVKWQIFQQYRDFLSLEGSEDSGNEKLIETIKPFLVFYRSLKEYAKHTQNHISRNAIALREAIVQSKEPEKTFFEDFPRALGVDLEKLKGSKDVGGYIDSLKECVRELRGAYPALLDRFEAMIVEEFAPGVSSFPEYKEYIQQRFYGLKQHRLSAKQKTLYQRIQSPIDDRDSWLESLSQALLGKSLERLTDSEELQLKDLLKEKIEELIDLLEISTASVEEAIDDLVKLEVTSFKHGKKGKVLPKRGDRKLIDQRKKEIQKIIETAEDEGIAAMIELLEERLASKD